MAAIGGRQRVQQSDGVVTIDVLELTGARFDMDKSTINLQGLHEVGLYDAIEASVRVYCGSATTSTLSDCRSELTQHLGESRRMWRLRQP